MAQKLQRKSLYTPEVYEDCLQRIGRLTPDSKPHWGSMTAAQMLAHCAEIQEVADGKPLVNTPFVVKLFKGMIRNMVVNDKPFPKNTRTHPQYRQQSTRDFETEKQRLLASLATAINSEKEHRDQPNHPLFGEMTREEKGWSMYKHLDHHLAQFGT